jgi:hypothetical protein
MCRSENVRKDEENAENRRRVEIAERLSSAQRGDEVLAVNSRRLRNSIISLAIFFALVIALLLGVPGLRAAADRISDAASRASRAPVTWCCSISSSGASAAA